MVTPHDNEHGNSDGGGWWRGGGGEKYVQTATLVY